MCNTKRPRVAQCHATRHGADQSIGRVTPETRIDSVCLTLTTRCNTDRRAMTRIECRELLKLIRSKTIIQVGYTYRVNIKGYNNFAHSWHSKRQGLYKFDNSLKIILVRDTEAISNIAPSHRTSNKSSLTASAAQVIKKSYTKAKRFSRECVAVWVQSMLYCIYNQWALLTGTIWRLASVLQEVYTRNWIWSWVTNHETIYMKLLRVLFLSRILHPNY